MFGQKRLRRRLAQLGVDVDEFKSLSQVVEEHAVGAPDRFPDGEPFPAREHLQSLAQATMTVYGTDFRNAPNIGVHIMLLMGMVHDPYEQVEPALLDAVEESCRVLSERGLNAEAGAMRDALAAVQRFESD